ncbi:Protein of unknown function [Paracoccus isoporae]|uniref:DUF3168 domain-containing protein n=1 Tax=Paracoccus isoporae TaxID=591205 RepID=A0A1G7EVX9_9RHOB|nr:DUF3168 domain-containing protein [Paracoccus isoporae]SDE67838.1 Protein of unknown function [Paracoccus isoporae]
MSYRVSAALQAAVYRKLRDDAELAALVGDAVFDALPIAPPGGVHIAIGPEEVSGTADSSGTVSRHDFTVSVLAGRDAATGFDAVKRAAMAVSAALEDADLAMERGRLAGLWFLKARATRVEHSAERRVDLTFRALVDLI